MQFRHLTTTTIPPLSLGILLLLSGCSGDDSLVSIPADNDGPPQVDEPIDSTDEDTVSAIDHCPLDNTKLVPGVCGCGTADSDTDSDGLADCIDARPTKLFGDDLLLAAGSASPPEVHGPRALASTWDGRVFIGAVNKVIDGELDITFSARAFRPEAINDKSDGFPDFTGSISPIKQFQNRQTKHTFHVSVCSDPDYKENPYRSDAIGEADPQGIFETYRLGIVAPSRAAPHHLLAGRGHVTVANPRTSTATIAGAHMDGPLTPLQTSSGDQLHRYEPSVTPDCRLILWHGRVDNDPAKAAGVVMYSYNESGLAPSGWSEPRSLSDMYYVHGAGADVEPQVAGVPFSQRYPLAQQPIRDFDGTIIPANEYLFGPYPWISYDGSEAFFPMAITYSGPARSAVVAVGQRTGWTLRHLDGAVNPSRSNLMPDIADGRVVSFETTADGVLTTAAYQALQRGDGQTLGQNGFQRLFMLPVALNSSMWAPSTKRVENVLPVNRKRGVYAFFLSHSARYVEVDLHQHEDANYVLYLPMNEQIEHNRQLVAELNAIQYSGIAKWQNRRESVSYSVSRTPDVSGLHHDVQLLNGAAFPYEFNDAVGTFQAAVDAYRADPLNKPGANAVSGDRIHGIVGNAVYFPGGSSVETQLQASAVNRLQTMAGSTIELWVKPLSAGGSYKLVSAGGISLKLENGNIMVEVQQEPVLKLNGSTIPAQEWSHIAVTFGPEGTTLFINAIPDDTITNPVIFSDDPSVIVGPYDHGATTEALYLIDEVAFSDTQRTESELTANALKIRQQAPDSPQWTRELPAAFADLPVHLPQGHKTPTDAQVALGERLFADTILSADNTISCASCHQPQHAFTDGLTVAEGATVGERNTPMIANRLFSRSQFMDGRASSLEVQSLQPIDNSAEHNFSVPEAIERLHNDDGYVAAFDNAYELDGAPLNSAHLAAALAAFERTLFSAGSRFDNNELNSQEQLGMGLFYGKARCAGCHRGPNFSDEDFHAIGFDTSDPRHLGREEATGRLSDRGKFRTPSLREIEHTAPYFHDGSAQTLSEVIDFYNDGGDPNHPNRDLAIQRLGLQEPEKAALIEFLRTLSGTTLPTSVGTK